MATPGSIAHKRLVSPYGNFLLWPNVFLLRALAKTVVSF
jgi:hypothetical protein